MAYILLTFCDTSLHVYGTTVAAYDTVVRLSVVTYCTAVPLPPQLLCFKPLTAYTRALRKHCRE